MALDPKTVAESLPLLAEAARHGFAGFKRWREPDNFTRLAQMLDERFESHEFIYGQDWTFLSTDAEAVGLLDGFFVSQSPLRPGLVEIVASKLDVASDAAPPLTELAEEVVSAIESLAHELWHDETDRIIFELRRLVGPLAELPSIRDQNETILARLSEMQAEGDRQVGSFRSAPDEVRPHLERLAEEDQTLALKLNDALLAGPSLVRAAANLIDTKPAWTTKGAAVGRLWQVLGAIAAKYGAWDAAETAYVRAADLGYGRRANVLAKAAEAAAARGDTDKGRELLKAAAREDDSDPAVAILEATALQTGDARLNRLKDLTAETPEELAAVSAARATAHLMEGRLEEANRAAEEALTLDPKSLPGREMVATIALFEGREALRAIPNVPKLRQARQTFLDLRKTLLNLGRLSEAARLLGRAVEVTFIAGEADQARELLEEAASDERLDETDSDARLELAEHAMTLRYSDLARRLVPPDATSEVADLVRATIQTTDPVDEDDFAAGIEMLDQLIETTEDDGVKGQAAISRLGATSLKAGAEWSELAENALRQLGRPEIADGLRAQYLQQRGQNQEAEDLLVASDDPRALDLLVAAAVDAEDYDLALARSERAIALAPSAVRRIEHAELLLRSNRSDEARALLAELRRDDAIPLPVRAKAYYLSVKDAHEARRYEDALAYAEEWMDLEPDEKGAAWIRVDALLWLGHASDAVAVARAAGLEPEAIGEARLLAHVYLRGLPAAEGLREIAGLSDRFNREDEQLEGLVIAAWAEARGSVSDDLEQRAALSLVEFPTRFPDSRAQARAVSIEELTEILRLQAEHTAELEAMGADMIAGRIPVPIWARAAGASVAQMWSSLRVMPLVSRQAAERKADNDGAAGGFGRGAVWDPPALIVVGSLSEEVQAAIRRALSRSVAAQAVVQDVDFAAVAALDEQPAEDETRLAWDPTVARPVAFVRPADDIEGERHLLREALRLVQDVEVIPDIDREEPTAADGLVPDVVDADTLVLAGVGGSLAVALRERLPIYSDDRVLRTLYRDAGVPAFGTVALLAVLHEHHTIDSAQHAAAIAALRAAGGIEIDAPAE